MKPELEHSYARGLIRQEYVERRTTSKTCCVDNKSCDFLCWYCY